MIGSYILGVSKQIKVGSMITLQELSKYLNELLACDQISDYSSNGLQVEGKVEVSKIATAVSASLETIEKAVAEGVDVLIVHHGLFWKGDPYPITGVKKKKLELLFKHGISLFGFHLPLDLHQELGNNWKAAKDMGWTSLEPFGLYNGTLIGVKGKVKKQSRGDFQKKLEEYYNHSAQSSVGGLEEIEKVALISGGAYKSLADAASEGMDCFVTGNFDEPAWYTAKELSVNFYALGHSATETIGPKALGEHLKSRYGLDHKFLDIFNPF